MPAPQRSLLLIRHGRPDLRGKYRSIGEHLSAYDAATIAPDPPPPSQLQRLAQTVETWMSSPLPRALSSLDQLTDKASTLVSPLFCEAKLPLVEKRPWIPLTFWIALLRVRWQKGLETAEESYDACLLRAQDAVECLTLASDNTPSLALVGHGYFNHLLALALTRKGWHASHIGMGYWSHYRLNL